MPSPISCSLNAIACVAMVSLGGCGGQSKHGEKPVLGMVAVIDLDAVAERLGADKTIAKSITRRQSSHNVKLANFAESLKTQLSERQQALSDTATRQEKVALATWQQQANNNLSQAKRQVETDLMKHRTELVSQFRADIKPIARKIAGSRGLSLIVTKNDSVVYDYTDSVDITGAVVQELLSQRSRIPPAVPQSTQ